LPETCFCRRVHFRAAHHYGLAGATPEQNRARFGDSAAPHFHDWTLTIWLRGRLDGAGMIVDLGHVDTVLGEEVTDRFHEAHINEVDPFFRNRQPTNEVLAGYFAERLAPRFEGAELVRVRVAEDPDLFAEWTA